MNEMMFYGLTQAPFMKSTKLPHPFESEDYREIQGRLAYLKEIKGLGVFTGASGTGKTSALRAFCEGLNPALYKVIYVKMTTVSPSEFLRQVATELGLDAPYRKSEIFKLIQDEIEYLAKEKRCTPVLFLDEAQFLSQAILRDLVMLLNFEMDSKDYAVLILSGLPSLNGILAKAVNESLRQRIAVKYNTNGLTAEEAEEYTRFVLKACGNPAPIFTEEAVRNAYKDSRGQIRQLNSILRAALKEGANQEKQLIDHEIVRIAHQEVNL